MPLQTQGNVIYNRALEEGPRRTVVAEDEMEEPWSRRT